MKQLAYALFGGFPKPKPSCWGDSFLGVGIGGLRLFQDSLMLGLLPSSEGIQPAGMVYAFQAVWVVGSGDNLCTW